MDTTQVSHHINLVKKDNIKWLRYANALIQGESLGKDAIPRTFYECAGCQWLSEHSGELANHTKRFDQDEIDLFHFDLIEQIVILRYELLEQYLQVFKMYLPELNNSFFKNIFRNEVTSAIPKKAKAKQIYVEMQQLVVELNKKLHLLEDSLLDSCHLNIA